MCFGRRHDLAGLDHGQTQRAPGDYRHRCGAVTLAPELKVACGGDGSLDAAAVERKELLPPAEADEALETCEQRPVEGDADDHAAEEAAAVGKPDDLLGRLGRDVPGQDSVVGQ